MALFRLHSEPEARIREDFDREAWPHFREIYRAALRLTRRPAEAEDLAQEVFFQAFPRRSRGAGSGDARR